MQVLVSLLLTAFAAVSAQATDDSLHCLRILSSPWYPLEQEYAQEKDDLYVGVELNLITLKRTAVVGWFSTSYDFSIKLEAETKFTGSSPSLHTFPDIWLDANGNPSGRMQVEYASCGSSRASFVSQAREAPVPLAFVEPSLPSYLQECATVAGSPDSSVNQIYSQTAGTSTYVGLSTPTHFIRTGLRYLPSYTRQFAHWEIFVAGVRKYSATFEMSMEAVEGWHTVGKEKRTLEELTVTWSSCTSLSDSSVVTATTNSSESVSSSSPLPLPSMRCAAGVDIDQCLASSSPASQTNEKNNTLETIAHA